MESKQNMIRRYVRRIPICCTTIRIFVWLLLIPATTFGFVVVNNVQRQQRQQQNTLLFSTTNPNSEILKATTTSVMPKNGITISSPYPTQRGTEVDSRKIIASSKQHLLAVRVKHILVTTQEMADLCLSQIRASHTNFADLANQVSACASTRSKGGEIGWINIEQQQQSSPSYRNDVDFDDDDDDVNQHIDEILPKDARDLLLQITTKPGDVCTVQSELGYHLIQIVDVMVDVRKMATKRQRNNSIKTATTNSWLDTAHQLTYKMETMGCQMNIADSERIEGQLQSLGIQPFVDDDDDESIEHNMKTHSEKRKRKKNAIQKQPDIIVLNTCSIRDHAEQKVYSYIGPHAKRKREGEDVTIIVAGCVAQQEGLQLLRRAPEVDLVMGPQYANRIGDLLEDVRMYGNQVVATEATHIMEDSTKPRRQSSVSAWVNIIYGCNERCTFCIVPTTRGVEQSRPVESIMEEINDLVQNQGYQEITLLGQNIDAYGRDMIPKRKFSDLLRTVGSVPGLQRVRFVTSHPRYMSMGVVDAVAETPNVCESFHIPFQSGSNAILNAMGRGHTREKYLRIIDRIRNKIPDASITADVIVGFPGETEEDFQDTLSLMKEVVFDSVNTAAYSPRPNTPAAIWENQVEDDIKQDRLQRINVLNKEHAKQRRQRMLGRIVDVLVEERNVQIPSQVMGRTRHGYILYFDGEINELRGKVVNVKIDRTETYFLTGAIVD